MTDMERDQIDADAELYIKTCVSAIQQLRSQGTNAVTQLSQLKIVNIICTVLVYYIGGLV